MSSASPGGARRTLYSYKFKQIMQSLLSLLLLFHHYPLNQGLDPKPLGTAVINADPQKFVYENRRVET